MDWFRLLKYRMGQDHWGCPPMTSHAINSRAIFPCCGTIIAPSTCIGIALTSNTNVVFHPCTFPECKFVVIPFMPVPVVPRVQYDVEKDAMFCHTWCEQEVSYNMP